MSSNGSIGVDVAGSVARYKQFVTIGVRRVRRHDLKRCAKNVSHVSEKVYTNEKIESAEARRETTVSAAFVTPRAKIHSRSLCQLPYATTPNIFRPKNHHENHKTLVLLINASSAPDFT